MSQSEAYRDLKRMYQAVVKARIAVDDLNSVLPRVAGHKPACIYDGTYDYACTCQPPTLWGRVLLWYCDCCGDAVASVKYGLCDNCKPHEYGSVQQARADHEVARLA